MDLYKKIVSFIYETSILKKRKHEGYIRAGVPVEMLPSIAEHSLRTAVIAYILAKLENYGNPYEVVTLAIFHDIEEIRIPDLDKIAIRYIKEVDKDLLLKEQLEDLGEIGKDIIKLRKRVVYSNDKDKAAVIVKDADYLEQAFTAKEYYEIGFKTAYEWIKNVKRLVRTSSAKKLVELLENTSAFEWWKNLPKFPQLRKK